MPILLLFVKESVEKISKLSAGDSYGPIPGKY